MVLRSDFTVKEILFNRKKSFVCESCGFHYLDKEIAERCEIFCSTHNSCSPEITKNSIERTKSSVERTGKA